MHFKRLGSTPRARKASCVSRSLPRGCGRCCRAAGETPRTLRPVRIGARMLTAGSGAGDVRDASFSANGALILTAGSGGEVRIFNARTSSLVRVLKVGSFIRAAAFSPDGRLVATASRDRLRPFVERRERRTPPRPCGMDAPSRTLPSQRTGNSWPLRAPTSLHVSGMSERGTAPAVESPAGCHHGVV